jgi:hypothetical protein
MASAEPLKINAWDFFQKLNLALSSRTVYVNGCFGASLDIPKNLIRYTKTGYNLEHKAEILAAAAEGHCFGFDCIGLVKSVGWWGWTGDSTKLYGGAAYKTNGMPDCSVHKMIRDYCKKGFEIKKDMDIPFLALLYDEDWSHIAVSIGNGFAIEATRYGDKPGVRKTYIKNAKHPLIVQDVPSRHYDAYAICKYINYKGIWKAVDAHGVMTVLTAVPSITPPVLVSEFDY